MKNVNRLIGLVSIVSLGFFSQALLVEKAVAEKVYTFGVVPQQSAKRLAELWSPVLDYIKQESGVQLRFSTAKNIPAFENRLKQGGYDFSYMNPYHFTVFHQSPGYQAVARRAKQPIKGIMVVRKDSAVKSLQDLRGEKLAFPSPAAFAASILTRAKLQNDNIDFTPRYVSSHDSVYLGVAKGLFKSGGGVGRTFNNTDPKVREQLKVLWTTDAYTPHAIASHPDMPAAVVKKVRDAFVKMASDKKGNALLQRLKIKKGLVPASNSDWDDVRALNIDALQ